MTPLNISIFFTLSLVSAALADDFKTTDGKEYRNAKVRRVEPDGIVLVTGTGISKVYFRELPKDVRDRFHYDAAKATAYSAQDSVTQKMFQSQQEELRRRAAEQAQKSEQAALQARNAPGVIAANRGQPIEVITHGGQVDITQHLAMGNVTIVDFYADWCGPCRQVSPTLEQMAQGDPEIALRKIDIVNWGTAVARQYNIGSIPQVNVYGRTGRLVGSVVGANVEAIKHYVQQAKSGGG